MRKITLLTQLLTVAILTGCSAQQRFVNHKKERNEPQPQRLEAPYNQTRETARPSTQPNESVLPNTEGKTPQVIEQELFLPGQNKVLFGILIEGRDGLVLSPYAPEKGLIDVRGFPPGSQVRDPYTGQIMKVPLPIKTKRPSETLSEPSFQTPNPTQKSENPNEKETPPTLEEPTLLD